MNKLIYPIILSLLLSTACEDEPTNPNDEIPMVKAASTYDVIVDEDITYAEGLSHDVASMSIAAMPQKLDIYYPDNNCLLYTSPSPRDLSTSRMPSSA